MSISKYFKHILMKCFEDNNNAKCTSGKHTNIKQMHSDIDTVQTYAKQPPLLFNKQMVTFELLDVLLHCKSLIRDSN